VDNINNTILAKHDFDYTFMGSGITTYETMAPKVGFAGSNFQIVFFANQSDAIGGGIRYVTINYLLPDTATLQATKLQTKASTSATNLRMDICSFSNRCFVAYTSLANDTLLRYIASDSSLSAITSLGTSYILNNVSLNEESNNLRVFTSAATGLNAIAYLYDYSLSAPYHPPVAIPLAGLVYAPLAATGQVYAISGYKDPTTTQQSVLIMQIKNPASTLGLIATATINSLGVYTLMNQRA
jgi:hypothetical protein